MASVMRLHQTGAELDAAPRLPANRRTRDAASSVQAMIDGRAGSTGIDAVLRLQRLAGNSGVSGLLGRQDMQAHSVQRQDDDDGGVSTLGGGGTGGGGGAGQWSIDNLSTNAHIALEGTGLKKAVIVVASGDQGTIGLK